MPLMNGERVARRLRPVRGHIPTTGPSATASHPQVEVLRLLKQGRSTKQIAAELHLTTVDSQQPHPRLFRALGVNYALEAVAATLDLFRTRLGDPPMVERARRETEDGSCTRAGLPALEGLVRRGCLSARQCGHDEARRFRMIAIARGHHSLCWEDATGRVALTNLSGGCREHCRARRDEFAVWISRSGKCAMKMSGANCSRCATVTLLATHASRMSRAPRPAGRAR